MAAADAAPGGTVGFGFQSQESDSGTDAKRTAVFPRCERAIFAPCFQQSTNKLSNALEAA